MKIEVVIKKYIYTIIIQTDVVFVCRNDFKEEKGLVCMFVCSIVFFYFFLCQQIYI